MATIKQKKAVEKLVENRGNVSRAMVEAGYTPATAKNPKNLTESKGYEEVLEEYGLTKGLVVKALVADIKGKPKARVKELNLGAEILGLKKNEGSSGNVNINFILPPEIAKKYGLTPSTEQDSGGHA